MVCVLIIDFLNKTDVLIILNWFKNGFLWCKDPCDHMLETAHFLNISSNNGNYSFLWNSGFRTISSWMENSKKYNVNYSFLCNSGSQNIPSWMEIVNNIMDLQHSSFHYINMCGKQYTLCWPVLILWSHSWMLLGKEYRLVTKSYVVGFHTKVESFSLI